MLEEYVVRLKAEMQKAVDTWVDLPPYVNTEEYEKALMDWINKHIENGRTDIGTLVVYALHHETGDRKPYFPFNRGVSA